MMNLRTIAVLVLAGLATGCALETASPRRARPTGNTTLFDQPPAGCAAGGAITANHDAAASSDQ